MDLISLALAALKLFNWIAARIDRAELRADERRRVFQEQMTIANERLGIATQIDHEIAGMAPDEVDDVIGDDYRD